MIIYVEIDSRSRVGVLWRRVLFSVQEWMNGVNLKLNKHTRKSLSIFSILYYYYCPIHEMGNSIHANFTKWVKEYWVNCLFQECANQLPVSRNRPNFCLFHEMGIFMDCS